jgi:hypothetical protein
MFYDKNGQQQTDGNCVFLVYCDGASFGGYKESPEYIPPTHGVPPNTHVYFRGIRNLDATLDYLLAKRGLVQAWTEWGERQGSHFSCRT